MIRRTTQTFRDLNEWQVFERGEPKEVPRPEGEGWELVDTAMTDLERSTTHSTEGIILVQYTWEKQDG